jgi:hypothetical protein
MKAKTKMILMILFILSNLKYSFETIPATFQECNAFTFEGSSAAAISHPVIHAIPPCNRGYLIPNSSVILVLNITAHLSSYK